jgi:hypothetical protein
LYATATSCRQYIAYVKIALKTLYLYGRPEIFLNKFSDYEVNQVSPKDPTSQNFKLLDIERNKAVHTEQLIRQSAWNGTKLSRNTWRQKKKQFTLRYSNVFIYSLQRRVTDGIFRMFKTGFSGMKSSKTWKSAIIYLFLSTRTNTHPYFI